MCSRACNLKVRWDSHAFGEWMLLQFFWKIHSISMVILLTHKVDVIVYTIVHVAIHEWMRLGK